MAGLGTPTTLGQGAPALAPAKTDMTLHDALQANGGLPHWMLWSITVITAVGMAVVYVLMVFVLEFLNFCKHHAVEATISATNVGVGILVLMGISALFAFLSASLVCFVAPVCAGGGVPELKGYISGNSIPGLFTWRTLPVRALGIVLALAGGLPYGREGPTMCVGVNLAILLTRHWGLPRLHHKVDMIGAGMGRVSPAIIVDEERYAYARRIAAAVGGSTGMAVIFNSPIGGLLYMLEEVSVTYWVPEATALAAFGTVCCTRAAIALLHLLDKDVRQFFIYVGQDQLYLWHWIDMLVFAVFAALIGLFSAAYTHVILVIQRRRRQLYSMLKWQSWVKFVEVILYAMLCAGTFGLVSLAGTCRADSRASEIRRFGCMEGEYNPLATLLLNDTGDAIQFLYRPGVDTGITLANVAAAFVLYTLLNIGAMGLPVPYGSFIPAMFIGALVGRFLGMCMELIEPGFHRSSIYALAGSAALLAAFTRKTLSIVVFLVEAVHDFDAIPPLLWVVFIAYIVTRIFSHHGLDEHLILMKGVPYLDEELPHSLDDARITAKDLCEPLPEEALLPREAPAPRVLRALEQQEVQHFPVVEGGVCIGLTTRPRLEAALRTRGESSRTLGGFSPSSSSSSGHSSDVEDEDVEEGAFGEALTEYATTDGSQARELMRIGLTVPIFRIIDPVPYTVLEDTPAPRLYLLFTRLSIAAVCVVSSTGEFRGVLSRQGMVAASRPEWGWSNKLAHSLGGTSEMSLGNHRREVRSATETDMAVLTLEPGNSPMGE